MPNPQHQAALTMAALSAAKPVGERQPEAGPSSPWIAPRGCKRPGQELFAQCAHNSHVLDRTRPVTPESTRILLNRNAFRRYTDPESCWRATEVDYRNRADGHGGAVSG